LGSDRSSAGDAGETELVLRARRGDRAAFEQLVRNVGRLLYAHLYLKTRDAELARDLTQETLLLAWKRLGELNDPAKFRPWLLTIASFAAIDSARHGARQKRGGGTGECEKAESLDDVSDPQPSPFVQAERNEERQRVLEALDQLPEEYRLPLSLRYLAGADYDEIGKQLALSNGSLRGLLFRGTKLLRRRLREKEPNES
jgi:RNA polymerase sigma-70 factor (ECF subfamily)